MNGMILRDALYNADCSSGSDARYAKGVIVGAVCGIMAVGYTFERALEMVKADMPRNPMEGVMPEGWDVI